MKKLLAGIAVCALTACGSDAGDDELQRQAERAAQGEKVELDLVDEDDDGLSAEQQAELKAWEERQNEDINKRLEEMKKR